MIVIGRTHVHKKKLISFALYFFETWVLKEGKKRLLFESCNFKMLVLCSCGWVSGHTTTQNKGTLLFIKTKESLRMHLKEAQVGEKWQKEDEEEEQTRTTAKWASARKSVAMTICGLFLFSFPYIYFFICLNFSYRSIFIFCSKLGI